MKSRKYSLTTFVRLVIVLLAVFGLNTQSYGLQFMAIDNANKFLYRIDTDNIGSPEFLGVIGTGPVRDLSELVRAGPNTLYALERTGNSLWTISIDDPGIPVIEFLDRDVTTHPRGMDLSPAGTLYGVLGMQLFVIDPATGTTTFISDITGAAVVEAIAFAPGGTLYAAGSLTDPVYSNTLYTLNISTGELTKVGTIEVNGNPVFDIDTLAFASDGYLYGADAHNTAAANLIRINPAAPDESTVVGNTGVTGLNGLTEYIEPVRTVAIDIKPGSDTNPINPRSQGVIPVAILTTDEFEATTVDPSMVQFAGSSPLSWAVEDVDYDGDLDFVFKFATQGTDIECGYTEMTLTGKTFDGVDITGTDSIKTVGCK